MFGICANTLCDFISLERYYMMGWICSRTHIGLIPSPSRFRSVPISGTIRASNRKRCIHTHFSSKERYASLVRPSIRQWHRNRACAMALTRIGWMAPIAIATAVAPNISKPPVRYRWRKRRRPAGKRHREGCCFLCQEIATYERQNLRWRQRQPKKQSSTKKQTFLTSVALFW